MRTAAAEAALADGRAPVWLLTLTPPRGVPIRMSSEAIRVETITAADGPYRFDPFLIGVDDYEESLDLAALSAAVALASARVEFTTTEDLAAMVSDWHFLGASIAELATLWPGERWEDRLVLLRGNVQASTWGAAGEPCSLTLESAPEVTSAAAGDASRDIGADFVGATDTAGDDMTDLSGSEYPLILGRPRSANGYKIGEVGGNNRLVLCGHTLPSASTVEVSEDGGAATSYTVSATTADPIYSYVEHATVFAAADGAYTWSAAASGGIARADALTVGTRTAADVVRYLLHASGVRVDWARMEPALRRLAGWEIGLFLDEAAPALDVLREQLLPWLPVVEVPGGSGLWLAWADPYEAPIEATLIAGQHLLGRLGGVEVTDRDAIRNRFTLAYARDEYLDEYAATVTLDADTDPLCALSQQLYGVLDDDPMECPVVWTEQDARRILRARARRFALQRRRVRYVASPALYWLRAGAAVSLTDAGLGIAGQRAYVATMRRGGVLEVVLELVDATPTGAL